MISKPVLVPEWKQAWRMLSVNIASIGVVMSAAWMALPQDRQTEILTYIGVPQGAVPLALFVAVIVGRLVNQPSIQPPAPPAPPEAPDADTAP